MLNPPEHQVGGHYASGGGLGPLTDGNGRFFKPLQSSGRGANELSFYTSFSSDSRVPTSVRRFFPSFHGTQLLPASDSSGPKPHLVLEDLTFGFDKPSIVDFKIGSRTWPHSSPQDYIDKCLKKDRETTSLTLGFRVSGLQIFEHNINAYYKPDRSVVRSFSADDVRRTLRRFVSDSDLASTVYGGSDGVLAQLLELKSWFEDQTSYHFYSASVLLMYERKDEVESGRVKLVDFAHVVEGNGVIDHNFLGGLCSLIKFVSEVLTDPRIPKAGRTLGNGE